MATAVAPFAAFKSGKPVMSDFNAGSSTYKAGDVVVVGSVPCVAHEDIPSFTGGQVQDALSVGGGIYACMADGAIGVGVLVFWDATAKKITLTATGNKVFGYTVGGPAGGLEGAGSTADGNTIFVYHDPSAVGSPVAGVASGYKIARGQLVTASASDTVVTGLTTVVSVVAVLESDLSADPAYVTAQIGDQAGAPAAGSIIIKTWKPTTGGAAGNPTPVAAATFSKKVNWIAIGT